MERITVRLLSGEHYAIRVRRHVFTVDQPVRAGGTDLAPTPSELLVASLASCTAHLAGGYLRRHGFPAEGLRLEADFEMATHPARVRSIRLRLLLPAGVPDEWHERLRSVVERCTVHNTLAEPPEIRLDVRTPELLGARVEGGMPN